MSDLTVEELEIKLRHRAIHHAVDAAMRSLQSRHNVLLRQLLEAVELAQYGSIRTKAVCCGLSA